MSMSLTLVQSRQPEPTTTLVKRSPVKEGRNLSENQTTWEDLRGLTWLFVDDWSE